MSDDIRSTFDSDMAEAASRDEDAWRASFLLAHEHVRLTASNRWLRHGIAALLVALAYAVALLATVGAVKWISG